jgi:hypothetical protein
MEPGCGRVWFVESDMRTPPGNMKLDFYLVYKQKSCRLLSGGVFLSEKSGKSGDEGRKTVFVSKPGGLNGTGMRACGAG